MCWRERVSARNAPEVLRGEHRLLLVLYRLIYPKASADEVRAFISREASDHAVFTRAQVGRAEKELGFTTKRASPELFRPSRKRMCVAIVASGPAPGPLGW